MSEPDTNISSKDEQMDDLQNEENHVKETSSEKDEHEDSMSQQGSVVMHSTPEKGFDSSYEDLTSPQQARSPADKVKLPDSPATPQSVSSYEPESSFEIITEGQGSSKGGSSRVVSSSSASTSSFFSQPKPTKVTITAPPNKDQSTPSRVVQSRPYPGIVPRHPSTRPQASSQLKVSTDSDSSPPNENRRRSSSHLHSSRSSLSPLLSPIPDVASPDDGYKASFPKLGTQGPDEEFPEDAPFAYIVQNGKNSIGDLSKSARKALSKRGLRSIPSMHGPLSLPYARCPSGIDAFLFSADKEEDPWTFLLEDDKPKRGPQRFTPGGYRINPVPLPGNSRYAQPGGQLQGRLPRGPAGGGAQPRYPRRDSVKKSWSKSVPVAGSRAHETEYEVATPSTTTVEPMLAMQQAQLGVTYSYPQGYEAYAQQHQHYPAPPPSAHPSTRAPSPYQHPPSAAYYPLPAAYYPLPAAYQPAPYPPPSPYYGGFPFPTAAEFMQSVHQHQHQYPQSPYMRPQSAYAHPQVQVTAPPTPTAPYGYPPPSQSRAPLLDPAIVAYGQNQQQQWRGEGSIYYTAPSEGGSSSDASEGEEEPQRGGFFFPASRPTAEYDDTTTRRRSASATAPGAPRRPSIDLPAVESFLIERRNSSAPSVQRRMSLAPAVTVAARRSSVAPQTRLVKDSHLTQSFASGGVSTSAPPQHLHGGAKAVRQPRAPSTPAPSSPPRIPLVPNHARATVSEASTPRRNSRASLATFTAAAQDAGIEVRRGSNASAGGWGNAVDQGWSPQSASSRSKKKRGGGRGGRKRGSSIA